MVRQFLLAKHRVVLGCEGLRQGRMIIDLTTEVMACSDRFVSRVKSHMDHHIIEDEPNPPLIALSLQSAQVSRYFSFTHLQKSTSKWRARAS